MPKFRGLDRSILEKRKPYPIRISLPPIIMRLLTVPSFVAPMGIDWSSQLIFEVRTNRVLHVNLAGHMCFLRRRRADSACVLLAA